MRPSACLIMRILLQLVSLSKLLRLTDIPPICIGHDPITGIDSDETPICRYERHYRDLIRLDGMPKAGHDYVGPVGCQGRFPANATL